MLTAHKVGRTPHRLFLPRTQVFILFFLTRFHVTFFSIVFSSRRLGRLTGDTGTVLGTLGPCPSLPEAPGSLSYSASSLQLGGLISRSSIHDLVLPDRSRPRHDRTRGVGTSSSPIPGDDRGRLQHLQDNLDLMH